MGDTKDNTSAYLDLNMDGAFDIGQITQLLTTLESLPDNLLANMTGVENTIQKLRIKNSDLYLAASEQKRKLMEAEALKAQMAILEAEAKGKRALLKEEQEARLAAIKTDDEDERKRIANKINDEFAQRFELLNEELDFKKKRTEEDNKKEAEQRKKLILDEYKKLRQNRANSLLNPSSMSAEEKAEAWANFGKRDIRDKDGNKIGEGRTFGGVLQDTTKLLADLSTALTKQIDDIAAKKSAIDTRLQGSKNSTWAGSYWDQMSNNIVGYAGVSPLIKQSAVADKVASMVESGIAFNVEQRATLDVLKDKIATTFEATNATLTRLVRIQQQDTTAARLGMESALTSFLNEMYETTEYMKGIADSVKSNLEEAMSLMSGENALSFEYQVQKWMGSMYSVGMSQSSVSALSGVLGQIAAGQLEGLTNGTTGNLAIMAANKANLSIADMMAKGLDESSTNKLMTAMVDYLGGIYDETKDNKVIAQQYASIFGLTASDLKAIANLSSSRNTISKSGLSYNAALDQLYGMAGSMYARTSMGEMLGNAKDNLMYTMAAGIASNPVLYATKLVGDMLDTFVGGIELPFINTFFGGVDLHTSVADIMRAGAMAGGIFSGLGRMITSGSGGGISGRGILNAIGVSRSDSPTMVTRGTGRTAYTISGQTTSESGTTAGNSSGDDIQGKSMSDANDSKDSQLAQATEDTDEVTIKDVNENVIKIYDLLNDVVTGTSKLHVELDSEYNYSGIGIPGSYGRL